MSNDNMDIITEKDIENLAIKVLYQEYKNPGGIKEIINFSTDYSDFNRSFNLLPREKGIKVAIGMSLGPKNKETKEISPLFECQTSKEFEKYSTLVKRYFKSIKENRDSTYVPFIIQVAVSNDEKITTTIVTPAN
jgi:hypothetical protein